MDLQMGWLIKFFTYSSIQVKLIATLLAIFVFIIIRRLIIRLAIDRINDDHIRYKWQKSITYTVCHIFNFCLF